MKSSIEQLFDEIFKIPFNTPKAEDLYCEIMDLKEKYKQMHEQEVTDAYEACLVSMMTSKQYYNETFKSE